MLFLKDESLAKKIGLMYVCVPNVFHVSAIMP